MVRYMPIYLALLIIVCQLVCGCGDNSTGPGESTTPEQPFVKVVIAGRVCEGEQGLSDVSVCIAGGEVDSIITTGLDGEYRLEGVSSGKYSIIPIRSGYVFTPENIEIDVSDTNVVVNDIVSSQETLAEWKTVQEISLVPIPSGVFLMGCGIGPNNEQPLHMVALPAFYMSSTEITQKQYLEVMGSNSFYFGRDDLRPEEQVSWEKAVLFCNNLSELTGREKCYDETTWECDFKCNGFRLPTEAEWEYACRANTQTEYYSGDAESDLASAGWYGMNSNVMTHRVGGKEPNAWGLYDMHGNVWEWCNDRYSAEYYICSPKYFPSGSSAGELRVLRGGSWMSNAVDCRSTFRAFSAPEQKYYRYGFRIACNK